MGTSVDRADTPWSSWEFPTKGGRTLGDLFTFIHPPAQGCPGSILSLDIGPAFLHRAKSTGALNKMIGTMNAQGLQVDNVMVSGTPAPSQIVLLGGKVPGMS